MNGHWTVRKRNGEWRIIDPTGAWHDRAETLYEAHTLAQQQSMADVLFSPGGVALARFCHWAATTFVQRVIKEELSQ